jgi:hypothetical protein
VLHTRVVEPSAPKAAAPDASAALMLPKSIDIGFAQLTITAKSVSVEEDAPQGEAKDGEDAAALLAQNKAETCPNVIGEVFGDTAAAAAGGASEIQKIVWYTCSLRGFWTVDRVVVPPTALAALVAKLELTHVYVRKGRTTYRKYAIAATPPPPS